MYNTFIFQPLYNGFVLIMDLLPWADVGVAVIIFTVIIRLILFPLSKSALLTQVRMKEVEPEINRIKSQYASDKQTQALKTMELYKSKGVKPLSGILLLFIQLPILFAIISVFYQVIPAINTSLLYSFVSAPIVNPTLLGLDLTQKSLILCLITAIIQFLQMHFSLASKQSREQQLKALENKSPADKTPVAASMADMMNKQMKFMLPIMAFVSTYWLIPASFPKAASIIAIYWSVSALFTLGQELVVRKRYLAKK